MDPKGSRDRSKNMRGKAINVISKIAYEEKEKCMSGGFFLRKCRVTASGPSMSSGVRFMPVTFPLWPLEETKLETGWMERTVELFQHKVSVSFKHFVLVLLYLFLSLTLFLTSSSEFYTISFFIQSYTPTTTHAHTHRPHNGVCADP